MPHTTHKPSSLKPQTAGRHEAGASQNQAHNQKIALISINFEFLTHQTRPDNNPSATSGQGPDLTISSDKSRRIRKCLLRKLSRKASLSTIWTRTTTWTCFRRSPSSIQAANPIYPAIVSILWNLSTWTVLILRKARSTLGIPLMTEAHSRFLPRQRCLELESQHLLSRCRSCRI